MTTIKINKQIATLRKRMGFTQEELAKILGVSNQAVSKWESAQCCPDIQLLPKLAELFRVSVDELLGLPPAAPSGDLVLGLRMEIESLPKSQDANRTFQMAAALHTILLSKEMAGQNPGWDTEAAIAHAGKAEWGYSCCASPEMTTTMRHGAVFFSSNKHLPLSPAETRQIAAILKPFADADTLRIAAALYQLTVFSEDAYVTIAQIRERAGLSIEKVQECLDRALLPFLAEKSGSSRQFRFKGMYMNILPILSLLDFK